MKKRLAVLLIFVIIIIYTVLDFTRPHSAHLSEQLKYLAILACFWLSTTTRKEDPYLFFSFCFLIISDFLLLFTTQQTLAIVIFTGTHLMTLARFNDFSTQQTWTLIFVTIVLQFVAQLFFAEDGLSALYGVALLSAAFSCFRAWKHANDPCHRLALLGMVLFVLCDLSVLVYNRGGTAHWINWAYHGIWLFYIPGITCLSLSGRQREGNHGHGQNRLKDCGID